MMRYILRRLFLLPLTLFLIILVNFVIINLAPGEPVTMTDVSPDGATQREDKGVLASGDERYWQFRERYGLTLPILINTWPWITLEEVELSLKEVVTRKLPPNFTEEVPVKRYDALKIRFGDQSRFIIPQLTKILSDESEPITIRKGALLAILRGAKRLVYLGPNLNEEQKAFNKKIEINQEFLRNVRNMPFNTQEEANAAAKTLTAWVEQERSFYNFYPNETEKWGMLWKDTRFYRYMSRILTLDFGTIRNDNNKTVVSEVTKRFKYSLTLSIIPLILSFGLSLVFGMIMAFYRNTWIDRSLNYLFLILYAIPIFVVAPFLIEHYALQGHFWGTSIPVPLSGFSSPDPIYLRETTWERFWDILRHLMLPFIAILYGSMSVESRIARTAFLEVMEQDYVRTAKAKGLPPMQIIVHHIGRNGAITLITSLASSLGAVLGGALIVETLFEIPGFGKFFYDAIVNRDYNVMMFSALAGSFLSLMGYLAADLSYVLLDPRISLEKRA